MAEFIVPPPSKKESENTKSGFVLPKPTPTPETAGFVLPEPTQEGTSFFGDIPEAELKKDPEFIKAAKSIYKWNEGRTFGFEKEEPKKLNSDEEYANYALRYMGWFNYNIPKMGKEVLDLKSASEEQKNDFVTLMDKYDQKKVSLAGTGRFAAGVLSDPSTYVGIGTFGAGLAARETAKAAAKRSIREMVKSGLKVGGTIGALEGATYTVVDDALRQSARIQAGQQEGYDVGQGAKAAALGTALGGALGGTVGGVAGRIKGKKLDLTDDIPDTQEGWNKLFQDVQEGNKKLDANLRKSYLEFQDQQQIDRQASQTFPETPIEETPKPKAKSNALPESLKIPPKPKLRTARQYLKGAIGKDSGDMGDFLQALEGKSGQLPPAYRAKPGTTGIGADGVIARMQEDGFYPKATIEGDRGTTAGQAESFYDDIAVDKTHPEDQLALDIYNQQVNEIQAKKELLNEYGIDPRGMSDEDVAKVLQEIQDQQIPPARIKETPPMEIYEQAIRQTDEPMLGTTDFQQDTTVALNQKVIDVGTQIMDELDIPRNPKVLISDQIKEAILLANENKIYRDKFAEVLSRNNLTVNQLSDFFRESVADSARRMQQLSVIKQSLKKVGQDLGEIEKQEGFYSNFIDNYSDIIRSLDNIRRGLLVSQIATAMRNNTAQIGRVMLNTLVQAFDGALNQTFNPVRKAFGAKEQLVDHTKSFRLFMNLTKNKSKAKDLTEFLTKYYVNEGDKLFTKYASEVADSSKAKVFKGAQKAVDGLNFLNRMQEFYYRRGMFATSIQNTLAEKGIDINKIGIGDDLLDYISADDVSKAVDDALYFTYAKTPDNTFLKKFVEISNSVPFITTGVLPFARFMANAVEFQFKHSPVGFGLLLRPKEYKKIASGDTSAISQAMVGTTLLLATIEAKRKGPEDQKWYEVQTSTGKTVDMRPYFPLTPYMFVADVITRIESGRNWGDAKDILQALTGAQFRAGAALGFVNNLLNGLSGLDTQEKINRYMSDFVADVLGGFATPLRMFNDFLDQEQEFRRPELEGEFFPDLGNKLLMNVPVARERFPEVESPTRAATPGRPETVKLPLTDIDLPGPLTRQLSGITVREEKNDAEREFDRLGFKMRDILPYSGNERVDQTRAKYIGPLVESTISPFVKSEGYLKLSNAKKELALRTVLKEIRGAANDYIKENRINEIQFQKAAFNRQPKYIKKLLNEAGIEWETLRTDLEE